MDNWMIELENEIGTESAQFVLSVLAITITVATIIIGNWNIFVS